MRSVLLDVLGALRSLVSARGDEAAFVCSTDRLAMGFCAEYRNACSTCKDYLHQSKDQSRVRSLEHGLSATGVPSLAAAERC